MYEISKSSVVSSLPGFLSEDLFFLKRIQPSRTHLREWLGPWVFWPQPATSLTVQDPHGEPWPSMAAGSRSGNEGVPRPAAACWCLLRFLPCLGAFWGAWFSPWSTREPSLNYTATCKHLKSEYQQVEASGKDHWTKHWKEEERKKTELL